MESHILSTPERETIQAVRSIERLSQLCDKTVNTSGYLNPLVGLTRLVEATNLLTPPGFDAVPSTSAAYPKDIATGDIRHASTTFNPCLTSGPGVVPRDPRGSDSRGKRVNFGSDGSCRKRFRLEDNYKTIDLCNSDLSVYEVGSDPDLGVIAWSDELLKTWNDTSFTLKADDIVAVLPDDCGLNAVTGAAPDNGLSAVFTAVWDDGLDAALPGSRDVWDELKPNQEHEWQYQVGQYVNSDNAGELTTLVRQMSQEITRISIEQRRQAALNRRRDNVIQRQVARIEALHKDVQRRQCVVNDRVDVLKQVERIGGLCKDNTDNSILIKEIHEMCKDHVTHSKKVVDLMFNLNRFLQLKLPSLLPVAGPSSTR
ncbi:uncharacterized protein LOC143521112 [Brachyhypopomus gauderio]|uniref:uncharacterized protein LOC143521112 n=1 Tax=Brachyhypopomus gauderio TaxID=698409 RepID=UPI00404321A6